MYHTIVYDLSHWNSDTYFIAHRNEPMILKCMNGASGIDDQFSYRVQSAKNVIGVYDYAYAGTDFKQMGIRGRIKYKGIHYLDIEGEYFNGKKPTTEQLVNDLTDFFGTDDRSQWYIYTGEYLYSKHIKSKKVFNGIHVWLAKYPTKSVIDSDTTSAWLDSHQNNKPKCSPDHILDGWQFTSAGGDRSEWYHALGVDKLSNPYPYPKRTLKKGCKGDDVKWLQWYLGIEIDGSFGKLTDKAVREFQKAMGIEVDGYVGSITRGCLTFK